MRHNTKFNKLMVKFAEFDNEIPKRLSEGKIGIAGTLLDEKLSMMVDIYIYLNTNVSEITFKDGSQITFVDNKGGEE